jgi:hypothetical protein
MLTPGDDFRGLELATGPLRPAGEESGFLPQPLSESLHRRGWRRRRSSQEPAGEEEFLLV